jgi:hypothetical protein
MEKKEQNFYFMNGTFTLFCLPSSDTGSSLRRRNLDPDLHSAKQYVDPRITVIYVDLKLRNEIRNEKANIYAYSVPRRFRLGC